MACPSKLKNTIAAWLLIFTFNTVSGQGTGEVAIAEMLMFTNELADYSNDPDMRKVMNGVNGLYNTTYDLKDALTGHGSASALNQSVLELANSLADISDNPQIRKTVKSMNEWNSGYQSIKSQYGAGMDATTSATMDGVAAAVQGAIILDGLFSKKKMELTKGQIAAKKYMIYTNRILEKLYNEHTTLPVQRDYDIAGWESIAAFESRLDNYDKATAKQRLLVLKYLRSPGIPEFSMLMIWSKEIKSNYTTHGLEYIKTEIEKLAGHGTDDYLTNAHQSLKSAKGAALLFKVNYYYKNGNEAEAAKITEQLAAIAPYKEVKEGINTAFEARNYKMAAQLYPVFFSQWYQNMSLVTNNEQYLATVKKMKSAAPEDFEKKVADDIAVIGKGLVALVKNGQYTNAATNLAQATTIYDDFIRKPKRKGQSASYTYNPEAGTEAIYFNHAAGEILQQQGKYAEALQKIDSAIYYAHTRTIFYSSAMTYVYRITETKIDLLIQQKQFDKALSECAAVERGFISVNTATNYDAVNFKFMKALIFYNMGKYQPALSTLTALKAINPDMPKAYLLEKEIYLAMNDRDAAKKAEEVLYQLYHKQ